MNVNLHAECQIPLYRSDEYLLFITQILIDKFNER